MPLHHPGLAHALGARGADEIGRHDLEHRSARRPGKQRHRRDAERHGRQQQIFQAAIAIAETRQPAELQRKDIHHHQSEPEFCNGQARHRQDHGRAVDETARPQCSDEAERNAEQNRKRHGGEDQLQRRPGPLGDHGRDRLAGPERRAEITGGELGDIGAETHIDGIVEAELLLQAQLDLGIGVVAHGRDDAAGNDAEQHEDQQPRRRARSEWSAGDDGSGRRASALFLSPSIAQCDGGSARAHVTSRARSRRPRGPRRSGGSAPSRSAERRGARAARP